MQKVTLNNGVEMPILGVSSNMWAYALFFLSADTGFAVDRRDSPRLRMTVDGGKTWTTKRAYVANGPEPNGPIVFPSHMVGYASEWSKPGIARTTDGGNTWIPFLHEGWMNFPIQEIHAMHFPSSLGYIVGSVKEVWKLPCVLGDMQIAASGPASFKEGDSVVLTLPEALRYKWSTGDTTRSIVARKNGQYIGDIVLADRCVGIDTVSVRVQPQVALHGYAAARSCIIARYEQVGSLSAVDGGDERGDAVSATGALQVIPNPLEATSRINYRVAHAANVTLTLYTQLGETVATLVNEHQEPGSYTLEFFPADHILSAGIYYLRLSAGEESSVVRVLR